MNYGCDLNILIGDPINDPIAVGEDFANRLGIKLWNYPTDERKLRKYSAFLKNCAND